MRNRIVIVGLLGAVAACGDATGPAPVESVTVTPNSITIASGATAPLTAAVFGKGGAELDGRAVTWASSNEQLATVNGTGLVTARFVLGGVAESVTITATAGGVSGTASVSVDPSLVSTVRVEGGSVSLDAGGTRQLTAVLRDAQGNTLTGRSVNWLSRDTTTARVSATGELRAGAFLGPSRTSWIIASAGIVADSIAVTVAPTVIQSIAVTPRAPYLAPGLTRRMRASALSPTGEVIPGVVFTWSSSAPDVASIAANGTVSAVGLGVANVTATVGAQSITVPVTVNPCGAAPAGMYPIEVRYTAGPPAASIDQAFICAVDRIRAALVGAAGLPVNLQNFNINSCAAGVTLNEQVDGLIIYATIEPIDGVGGILGSAGPCFLRTDDGLPVIGRMRFDVADLNNLASSGRLGAVIMHEMLHVIGVGTVWSSKGLLTGIGGPSPRFSGALAREACVTDHAGAVVCNSGVPVENCEGIPGCGAGTINSHWREPVFTNELMTGYLSPGFNPFSKMSIQSLADLGYDVDAEQADDFSLPTGASVRALGPVDGLPMPAPTLPTHYVDRWGRATPIPQR